MQAIPAKNENLSAFNVLERAAINIIIYLRDFYS